MNNKTIACIGGYRHTDYNKTVKTANFARKIITGEGYGELVINYKPRETDLQKEQRIEITNAASKAIAGKIEGFFKRPYRMDKIRNLLEIKAEASKSEFLGYVDTFGKNGEGLLTWCENTALNQNGIDPNSFVWVKPSNENTSFEGVVFPSANVLDYDINKGLVSFCVLQGGASVTYQKDGRVSQKDLIIYYTFTLEALEISMLYFPELSEYYTQYENPTIQDVNGTKWIVSTYPITLDFIPVTRVGYKDDKTTMCRTFVPYWDNASELYKEQANRVSEYCLSLALHVFYQKVAYYTDCDYQENASSCRGGTLFPSKKECPSCKGSGRKVATTTQDIIEIKLPDNEDGQPLKVSPRDLVHYVELPLGIVEHQKKIVDEFAPKITESVFGVDISHQNNQATTATQVINYYDTAQDTLYEFTKAPRNLYLFCIKCIAGYSEIEVTTDLQYAQQYDLESEKYLLELLKDAKDSAASPEVVENIIDRLIIKQNRIDGAKSQVYKAMRGHKPFGDLSNEMLVQYVLSLPETDLRKVKFLNFKQISDEVYNKVPNFLLLDFNSQAKKVDEIAKRISEETIATNSVLGVADLQNSDINLPIE